MRYAYTIVSSSAAEDNMISAAPIEKKYWKYCPFCGSQEIKIHKNVPRCMSCRYVFFVTNPRKLRAAPKRKTNGSNKHSSKSKA